jgi:hypothetical protein
VMMTSIKTRQPKVWRIVIGFLTNCAVMLMASYTPSAGAQQKSACMLQKDTYQCDWSAFKRTLKTAQTVSLQSEPLDGHTDAALRQLAERLSKNAVERSGQPSDLVFVLSQLNKSGIFIGPEEEDLGTLRVYKGKTASDPGTLVWTETYRGTKDIPWPSVEYYLLRQFEDRLKA